MKSKRKLLGLSAAVVKFGNVEEMKQASFCKKNEKMLELLQGPMDYTIRKNK